MNFIDKETMKILEKFIHSKGERSDVKNINETTLQECIKWCRSRGEAVMRSTDVVRAWKVSQAYFAIAEKLEIAIITKKS